MGPAAAAPHIPVLIGPLIETCAPISGTWLDGTFGAGGYAKALLEAGAEKVIGLDRDPSVFDLAVGWAGDWPGLELHEATFSELDRYGADLDGVVLDLGVSSMQLDQAERGFSFLRDGPLDMRMGAAGPSAADIVNRADETLIADILYRYGEERQSRRIARAIARERPLSTTAELAALIERCLPRPKPGQSHPATRSFQALRIAVNDEYGELAAGLMAAERALRPGGLLAVVSFHSVEDRIVKRFIQARSTTGGGSRHAPERQGPAPGFESVTRKAVGPSAREVAANPRARSAKLRVARRTAAPAAPVDPKTLGMPVIRGKIQ